MLKKTICLILCLTLLAGLAGCGDDTALIENTLTAIAENETVQNWLSEHDVATLTESAVTKFKESIPMLAEFLSREDVKEQFETVGLPLIEEFLSYNLESMKLKAETLGRIIEIFAPELTEQVEEIFRNAENQ